MKDFLKGKAKLASAMTVFTNSLGAVQGNGAYDAYQTNLTPQGQAALQQDIAFGQMNHLTGTQDIKFPDTASPGAESQYLMQFLLKNIAMSFNLPYSFALDAGELGGVSSRLESEQAKAEFLRGRSVLEPKAHKLKNALLIDACAKGIFPASATNKICRGRWGYRPHPQPDIGKEANADVTLWQNGLRDPMNYWTGNGQDPETVARNMARWVTVKKAAAKAEGHTVEEVFGSGPAMPVHTSVTAEDVNTGDDPNAPDASQRVADDAKKVVPIKDREAPSGAAKDNKPFAKE